MVQNCKKVNLEDETEMTNRESRIRMPNAGGEEIMQLMAAGNSEDFVAALASEEDVNRRCLSNQSMTLLEHACCVDYDGVLIEQLLQRGARADDLNTSEGCRALHFAAANLNHTAICLLLQNSNPNALNLNGDNVLHVLCSHPPGKDVTTCVSQVLRLCAERSIPLDVNHRNKRGETPVFQAAGKKNEPVVRLLLEHGCSIDSDDVQLSLQLDEQRQTTRQLLQPTEWPEFQHPLPPEREFRRDLFFLLYFGQEEEFVERLPAEVAANPALLNDHDGQHTLLQVAVEKRLERAVEALLGLGADPSLTQPSVLTASENAAYKGLPGILSLLIKNATLTSDNLSFHWLIRGADIQLRMNKHSSSEISTDYKKCFDTLLRHKDHKELLSALDNNKRTPLHLAVVHHMRDPYFVDILVENGALLGLEDKREITPLDIMTPAELQKFFDRRIEISDNLKPGPHEIFEKIVTFDMRFLRYFDDSTIERYDCQTLIHISKCPQRRTVLTHPLVECFLHMKWNAVSLFYTLSLVMHFIFALLLVTKFSLEEYLSPENSTLMENMTMGSGIIGDNAIYIKPFNYALALFLIFISVLTVFYYWASWDSLYSVKRCFLKVLILIFTFLFLSGIGGGYARIAIGNFAIFLASVELVLLLGDHPEFAARVRTLKTVASIFLKFFAWFSPVLLALVLCFVILFRDSDKSFLHNLGDWFVQSLFMFGRAHNAKKLMESETTPLSQFVLVLFIFFLVLVFSNVLNGLAVKDAIAINDDTKLYINISRIELLHHAERFLASLHKLCICENVKRFIEKHEDTLNLKPFLCNHKIVFEMKKKNKWITKSSSIEFILEDTDIIQRVEDIKKLENADVQALLKDFMRKMKK